VCFVWFAVHSVFFEVAQCNKVRCTRWSALLSIDLDIVAPVDRIAAG
jgi:hypothetical protein